MSSKNQKSVLSDSPSALLCFFALISIEDIYYFKKLNKKILFTFDQLFNF